MSLIRASYERLGELASIMATDLKTCENILRLLPAAVQGAWPDLTASVNEASANRGKAQKQIEATRDQLLSAYRTKMSRDLNQVTQVTETSETLVGPDRWVELTNSFITQIEQAKVSVWRASKADETRMVFARLAARQLSTYTAVKESITDHYALRIANLYADAHNSMVERGLLAAQTAAQSCTGALGDFLAEVPGIAPVWSGVPGLEQGFATGVAPVSAIVGVMRPATVRMTTAYTAPVRIRSAKRRPGEPNVETSGRRDISVLLPPTCPRIPVMVDFDADGGLIVSDPGIVKGVVIDLLAVLPPGRVKVEAVDPVGLGRSLDFLYPLGEAGQKVYGERVRTTAQDAAELMLELESHVAFVNQRYLGGEYESLTEYNMAAGEVAEPYRIVLLYDFPHAFTRDGQSWDEESLRRLQTLTRVGRRAGVFFLVVSPDREASQRLPDLPLMFAGQVDRKVAGGLGFPTSGHATDNVKSVLMDWEFAPLPPPDQSTLGHLLTHVERGLNSAEDVRVSPSMVARLAATIQSRDAQRGTRAAEVMADPDDPSTWWQSQSEDGVTARFGRSGARGVASITFSSQSNSALLGGRTGSGKSYLIHSIILNLALQYSPEELELYLIDFKEGVEFKQYAEYRLPHARVVAIESKREFGISVLESLDQEIGRRGALFRSTGGDQMDLASYRRASGERLPRIALVIDEFHMLFERDDRLGQRAAELLDRVIRQGRAFGVHTILASQSLAGGAQYIRTALNQIACRLVLASSEADSRMLLADDNVDAQLLNKPGEGIFNPRGGLKEANTRFQTTFWPAEHRAAVLAGLGGRAAADGWSRRPVVFEGNAPALVAEVSLQTFRQCDRHGDLRLPVGAPMSLSSPVTADLRRVPGANLLLVAEDGDLALELFIASLLAGDVGVDLVELAGDVRQGTDEANVVAELGARIHHRRVLVPLLSELVDLVQERHELSDYKAAGRVLILSGIHRARELDPDSYDETSPAVLLQRVLRDGPEVGIHVFGWVDRKASLMRRLSRDALREFAVRVVGPMNAEDSRELIDSDLASTVGPTQFVVDDLDRATTIVARRFAAPPTRWLRSIETGDQERAG